jgi:hypothetical protein
MIAASRTLEGVATVVLSSRGGESLRHVPDFLFASRVR